MVARTLGSRRPPVPMVTSALGSAEPAVRMPRGRLREHWYHGAGCGRWLIVERDNLSHAVHDVADAQTRALAGDRT